MIDRHLSHLKYKYALVAYVYHLRHTNDTLQHYLYQLCNKKNDTLQMQKHRNLPALQSYLGWLQHIAQVRTDNLTTNFSIPKIHNKTLSKTLTANQIAQLPTLLATAGTNALCNHAPLFELPNSNDLHLAEVPLLTFPSKGRKTTLSLSETKLKRPLYCQVDTCS